MTEQNESLADIARGDGVNLETGEQRPADQVEQPPAVLPDRRDVLEKPCALVWGGGCGLAAWATEVEQLSASQGEKNLAGHHLANILDAIMPDDWLKEFDPDSKAGRIAVSGAVLVMIIREKNSIYSQVIAEREAAESEKSESKAVE